MLIEIFFNQMHIGSFLILVMFVFCRLYARLLHILHLDGVIKLRIFKYNVINFDVFIHGWRHHHNQDK